MAVVDSQEEGTFNEAIDRFNTVVSDSQLQGPQPDSLVFKDECNYCFRTTFHEGGIYVCAKYFIGLCAFHINNYTRANPDTKIFLHIGKKRNVNEAPSPPQDKMQRLTIQAQTEEIEEVFTVVIIDELTQEYQISPQVLGENLYAIIQRIINAPSASVTERLESGVSEWDSGTLRIPEELLTLVQEEREEPAGMNGFKCEESTCDLTENLWINLTDGVIMCGRSQYMADGQLSKGNGHAQKYADTTKKPFVAKLGTIQKNGDGDVYSYADNDSVKDPFLRQHLLNLGVDVDSLEKTEKTTLEMEMDLNQKWEWSRVCEDGCTLEPAFGEGFTGMINIGSSCYINSAIQCLTEENHFDESIRQLFRTDLKANELITKHNDFLFQLAKLLTALKTDDYSKENLEIAGIKPTQYRKVAGRGHEEFSTAKQQDAEEYIRYLFTKIDDLHLPTNPVDQFRFKINSRFEDVASGKVRYTEDDDYILSLSIPKEKLRDAPLPPELENIEIGPGNQRRKCIDLSDLVEHYSHQHFIDGFRSPITQEEKGAKQQYRISSFPDCLVIQINRFEQGANMQATKMDIDVNVPDHIDMTAYRFEGQKPDEELLPDSIEVPTNLSPTPLIALNPTYVQEVMNLGFSKNACERAVYATNNVGVNEAAEWLLSRMDDPELNEPHPDLIKSRLGTGARAPKKPSGPDYSHPNILHLVEILACTPYQANVCLEATNNNVEAAIDHFFSFGSDIPVEDPNPVQPAPSAPVEESSDEPIEVDQPTSSNPRPPSRPARDGHGHYKLKAFITHMGRSPQSGHYVCHIEKNGVWYFFNDEKVASSKSPPKQLGYIYFYERDPLFNQ